MDVAVYRERIADFENFEEDDKEWDRIMMERAQAVPLERTFPIQQLSYHWIYWRYLTKKRFV